MRNSNSLHSMYASSFDFFASYANEAACILRLNLPSKRLLVSVGSDLIVLGNFDPTMAYQNFFRVSNVAPDGSALPPPHESFVVAHLVDIEDFRIGVYCWYCDEEEIEFCDDGVDGFEEDECCGLEVASWPSASDVSVMARARRRRVGGHVGFSEAPHHHIQRSN
ncbi:hypothetical protein Tco_1067138 [Tanacetum coccineum]|uniref:Uncharacterized protein n=1 Tax=Tanacetum coccineum TaxID=301880 RepID=A0ABQ5HDE6_9ASTR